MLTRPWQAWRTSWSTCSSWGPKSTPTRTSTAPSSPSTAEGRARPAPQSTLPAHPHTRALFPAKHHSCSFPRPARGRAGPASSLALLLSHPPAQLIRVTYLHAQHGGRVGGSGSGEREGERGGDRGEERGRRGELRRDGRAEEEERRGAINEGREGEAEGLVGREQGWEVGDGR